MESNFIFRKQNDYHFNYEMMSWLLVLPRNSTNMLGGYHCNNLNYYLWNLYKLSVLAQLMKKWKYSYSDKLQIQCKKKKKLQIRHLKAILVTY